MMLLFRDNKKKTPEHPSEVVSSTIIIYSAYFLFTRSLRALPALNLGALLAAIFITSPV